MTFDHVGPGLVHVRSFPDATVPVFVPLCTALLEIRRADWCILGGVVSTLNAWPFRSLFTSRAFQPSAPPPYPCPPPPVIARRSESWTWRSVPTLRSHRVTLATGRVAPVYLSPTTSSSERAILAERRSIPSWKFLHKTQIRTRSSDQELPTSHRPKSDPRTKSAPRDQFLQASLTKTRTNVAAGGVMGKYTFAKMTAPGPRPTTPPYSETFSCGLGTGARPFHRKVYGRLPGCEGLA